MKYCKLHLNFAGYCLAKASHAIKGAPSKDIQFKALFGLIQHPDLGWILFDTGYSRRFYSATKYIPNKLYALITKVYITENEELKMQLHHAGISANDIKHIIISHFHADHIGGLKDFNNARFYCSKIAWQQIENISNFMAFSKGILKELIPDDFLQRVHFIEDSTCFVNDKILGDCCDLFGDNSIIIFNIPGHAAGQIGIKLQTTKQTYLLAADACWDKKAYTDDALPNPIVKLFFDSWSDYKASILKLQSYHKQNPNHIIVPSHCFTSYMQLVSNQIKLDVL